MASEKTYLLKSSTLTRNAVFSLVSKLLPLIISILAIPFIIRTIGEEKFGLLTIAWVFVGYFNLFDLGISRALTKMSSERLGVEGEEEVPSLIRTASSLTFLLGIVGGILIFFSSEILVTEFLNVNQAYHEDVIRAIRLLAIGLPFTVSINVYKGVLESAQKFDGITWIQIIMGVCTYGGLVGILLFINTELTWLVGWLSLVKVIFFVIYIAYSNHVFKFIKKGKADRKFVRELLTFGGWVTVSSIVSPMMVFLDRLIIGSKATMEAVAYYSTPNDMLERLALFPSSLVLVLFPAFSRQGEDEQDKIADIYREGFFLTLVFSLCLSVAVIIFGKEILEIWINKEGFAEQSYLVFQILAIGFMYNYIARIPFAMIQGKGRPDITAKFHLIELPVYVLVLYLFIGKMGITGAAIASAIRMTADFLLLYLYANRQFKLHTNITPVIIIPACTIALAFYLDAMLAGYLISLLGLSVYSVLIVAVYWKFFFSDTLKDHINRKWKAFYERR